MSTSSDPSIPEPAAEIRLGVPESFSDIAEDRPRPGLPVGNTALALLAVVLLLVAGGVATAKLFSERRTEAELLVWSFLEAVLDGDAELAVSMTDHGNPSMLLPAEALDDRWEVVAVAQVVFEGGRDIEVYVEIETHDGLRIGDRLTVEDQHGGLRLSNALKRIQWQPRLGSPVVNGVDIAVGSEFQDRRYDLLPGPYSFGERHPPTLELTPSRMVALGGKMIGPNGDMSTSYVSLPDVVLSESGRDRLDEAVREFLDRCVDLLNLGTLPSFCPVGPIAETWRESDVTMTPPSADFEAARWEMTEYPIAIVEWFWGPYETPIFTAEPGTARVRLADGTELECLVWMEGGWTTFPRDGGVDVGWGPGPVDPVAGRADPGCSSFTRAE